VRSASRRAVLTPNEDGTPGRANPNLSSAIRAGERLFLSGMLGNSEATRGDVAAQTRVIRWRRIHSIMAEAPGYALHCPMCRALD
jgi:enamine deaminase RidA (YjgF/YER057c/UK114 family)